MKLQAKIWLGASLVIASIMTLDMVIGYRDIERDSRHHLEEQARIVQAMLMATRRVYQQQFLTSEVPLTDKTVGFLPAHALPRISADFPKWIQSDLRFNNVSDRARNPYNQADRDELAAMSWFRANPTVPDHLGVIQDTLGGEVLHFTAPIWIESSCLKCHGVEQDAPPTIRANYAGSYGYKLGELRGLMSIKVPMQTVRRHALEVWGQHYLMRGAGYVVLLFLVGTLMKRMVVRRLARLEVASVRLGAGDLGARVEVTGGDEISTLANSFNAMAQAMAQHDAEIARLNRIYATLSETNQTIVRVEDEADLLENVCRIAVEHGGFKMACIMAMHSSQAYLEVVCRFGDGLDFLDGIHIPLDPAVPGGCGPTATAWRTQNPVMVQDYSADPLTQPWHESAKKDGLGAGAAFPITRGGRVQFVLTIYHGQSHVFDQKMINLLSEMAMDIGYALDRIDLVAEQVRTHIALGESEEKYRAAVTTSQDGFWLADTQGRLLEVNAAYAKLSGYSREELLQMHIADLEVQESADQVQQRIEHIIAHGSALFETRHRCKDGHHKLVEVSVSFIPDKGGQLSVFIRDLSKREEADASIKRLSNFDALTGLPNRALCNDRFDQALTKAQRNGESLALVFLDLDHFQNVNDNLGHRIGDLLLVETTSRLLSVVRAEDTISRLGGDEFILLLDNTNEEDMTRFADKLLQAIARPVLIEGHELIVTASIGVALYPLDGDDFDTLFRRADSAASWAKQAGRNTHRFFAPEMQARSARLLALETALRKALERDELMLYYQPQISLASGAVIGVEALARWRHPVHGLVSPAEFIPIAESTGLILPIGEWVLRTALSQMKTWTDRGLGVPQVAVNLSAVQFRQSTLPATIKTLLADSGVPAERLEIELTESTTMDNPGAAIAMIDTLHGMGIKISIDDFGTGYSSLSYLKRFHIDKLKIDQSFVRDLHANPEDEAIVKAVVSLAGSLKFKTIAEGVETQAQLEFLYKNGCDEVQGYLFSQPIPADEFAVWMKAWDARPRMRCL